jgi:Phage integrase family/Domain of unknown function DUF11
VRPHRLRHTYGTELAAAGIDLLVLRELMGHASPETTAAYVHLPAEHLAVEYAAARAVLEIDADGGDSSNTAAASAQAYVVAETVPDQPPVTGALDHLTLDPATSSVPAGTAVTYTVTGYDAAGHDLGTPTGLTLTIAPNGSCSGATCTTTTAGAHTVTATAPAGTTTVTGTAALTVTAGPAAALLATSGDGQTAAAGQTFAQPLGVRVVDAYGNPVSGATATFAIASGATFTSGGTTSTAVSGSDGTATSSTLRAGSTPGPFTVTAMSGAATPVTFIETVTEATTARADLASSLAAPGSVRTGTAFKVTLTVTNRGPATASKTVAVLTLPYGVSVRDAGGGKVVRGAVLLNVGTLPAGASVSRTVTLVAARTSSRTRTLYGLGVSATPDPILSNNLSRAVISVQ